MDKKHIKEELMKHTDTRPFISQTELAKALHLGKDSTRTLVSGLAYLKNGKRKDYLIEDVAARLADRAQF